MFQTQKTKVLATLGPASSTKEMIRALLDAGADAFRLNMSHGTHKAKQELYDIIRDVEKDVGFPIAVLADLQGPKLRIDTIAGGEIILTQGDHLRLDMDKTPGTSQRVPLLHPEIFLSLTDGASLLINDGKIHLKVLEHGKDFAETEVIVGGVLSDRKGVNIPDVVLPVTSLTDKDRRDLDFALELGADWIALSFVQRPEDVAEARKIIRGRAAIMSKIEKPSAVTRFEEILELSDGVMVARGDLGVEMPIEEVPGIQKMITRSARRAGKPVVVATQMLESMIEAPVPTRAEVSDVAGAVYEGADAIMLSAESAVGQYPVEAVKMMADVALSVEIDPHYRRIIESLQAEPEATSADAITAAAHQVATTIDARAIVCFTSSGSTGLRAARERPQVPILCLSPKVSTGRRLALVWGLECVSVEDAHSFKEMVVLATQAAQHKGYAKEGERIVITAGVPFGTPGATNILRIAYIGA